MENARPLPTSLFLRGYMAAMGRLLGGGETLRTLITREMRYQEDPGAERSPFKEEIRTSDIFISLFEALNWAVALDDRIAQDWPANLGRGRDWYTRVVEAGSIRGLRYARNCVHHDWAMAIVLAEPFRDLPGRQTTVLWEWYPRLTSRKPDPDGEASFHEHLAGESVVITLMELSAAFAEAWKLLVESTKVTSI